MNERVTASLARTLGDHLLHAVLFLRAWFRPDIKIETAPGEVRLEQKCLPVVGENEAAAVTGLFSETIWVRDHLCRRRSVKLELLAGEYNTGPKARRRDKMDLIISVGATVQPGLYVAQREVTAIKVRVEV